MDDEQKIGCGIILLLLVIGAITIVLSSWTKTESVLVTGHHWRIEQQIEVFETRAFEGWDESVPNDARETNCQRRRRGSHEICTGSGDDRNCTDVTDYDQWCRYVADRWGYAWSDVNEGGIDDPVLQPEPNVRCNGVSEIGCERYGLLLRAFTVQFRRISDNSVFECAYDRRMWESLLAGNSYTMVFGAVLNEARCAIQEG